MAATGDKGPPLEESNNLWPNKVYGETPVPVGRRSQTIVKPEWSPTQPQTVPGKTAVVFAGGQYLEPVYRGLRARCVALRTRVVRSCVGPTIRCRHEVTSCSSGARPLHNHAASCLVSRLLVVVFLPVAFLAQVQHTAHPCLANHVLESSAVHRLVLPWRSRLRRSLVFGAVRPA